MVGVDAVLDETEHPFDAGVQHRALDQLAIAPLEALLAVDIAIQAHVGAARRRSRTGRLEVRVRLRRAVAVLALDLDRTRNLTVQMAVAMVVLREVTVDAVHALVNMNR